MPRFAWAPDDLLDDFDDANEQCDIEVDEWAREEHVETSKQSLRAELKGAIEREQLLRKELAPLTALRARYEEVELDLERSKMQLEDMCSRKLGEPSNPFSSHTPLTRPVRTSSFFRSAPSMEGGRTPERAASRKDKLVLPTSIHTPPRNCRKVSGGATPPPHAALSKAETLVLEMFGTEPSSVRSQALFCPEASHSARSSSSASVAVDSYSTRLHTPNSPRQPLTPPNEAPMLLPLNGCMRGFPSAPLSSPRGIGSVLRGKSCPLFGLKPDEGGD